MSDEPVEDVERHDDGRPGVTVEQHFPEGEPDQAEPVCAVTELSSLTAEVLVVFGDLAARWHSVAHERLHAGDDYNPAAIALCQTPRCREVLDLLERLRTAAGAAAAPGGTG